MPLDLSHLVLRLQQHSQAAYCMGPGSALRHRLDAVAAWRQALMPHVRRHMWVLAWRTAACPCCHLMAGNRRHILLTRKASKMPSSSMSPTCPSSTSTPDRPPSPSTCRARSCDTSSALSSPATQNSQPSALAPLAKPLDGALPDGDHFHCHFRIWGSDARSPTSRFFFFNLFFFNLWNRHRGGVEDNPSHQVRQHNV